jgi:hypothetical protein
MDGVLEASANASFSDQLNVLGSSFNVGFFSFQNGYYFNGKIDDIHVYTRYLSISDVEALYNTENPTTSIPVREK